MTETLSKQLNDTYDLAILEDLYLPFKKKRKTRSSVAKEKGLEPLALVLLEQNEQQINAFAARFLT